MAEKFVSYSINSEDVLLHRIFGARTDGFFVDVGAADPIDDNDFHALSEQGWSGINIEPNPKFFGRLQEKRSRDSNFNVALSDRDGTLDWFQVGETGLSTCDDAEAARAASKGYAVTRHTVPATTLAGVLGRVAPPAIDVLKVDVEGLELAVLRGNDWQRWRPKLAIVEATLPETSERRPDKVGPYLAEQGYRHVHFDGLNDWFAEAGFEPPIDAFLPPNVFDDFVTRQQASLQMEVRRVHAAAQDAHDEAREIERRLAAQCHDLEDELRRVHASAKDAHSAASQTERRLEAQCHDLEKELRRVHAAVADAQTDVVRSRAGASEAQERYTLLAMDFEAALKTIADRGAELSRCREANETEVARLHQAFASLSERFSAAEQRCRALEGSTSWRVTKPFRAVIRAVKRV